MSDEDEMLSNGQTIDEWLAEKKKTDRMLQKIDKRQEREDRRLFNRLHKRWMEKSEVTCLKDPEYADLVLKDVRGKSSYTSDDMHIMFDRYSRRHQLVTEPWYLKALRWRQKKWDLTRYRVNHFKYVRLHIRTDSPFWHVMHNGDWACPDCDTFYTCRSQEADPDHLCTAQIVDIDKLTLRDLDVTDDRPWLDKALCYKCGYTIRVAKRTIRKGL